jgi:hypothetical protein
MIKTFNDLLALIVMILIIILWALQGLGIITLPGEIIGATIAIFTLIGQFYFRKSKPADAVTVDDIVPGTDTPKKK